MKPYNVASGPELLGLVFTNGTLLDDERADWFARKRNMVPLFSIEGSAHATNKRRGHGVAERVEHSMLLLSERATPFGVSITTGEHNIQEILCPDFLARFVTLGCRLFIFSEYVPVDDNADLRVLTEESKLRLNEFCKKVSKEKNLILIPFPGDESIYGGCLAAGRGFAHISASGDLEPCPFAAASDSNVFHKPFTDALTSPLFHKIRSESHLLHEGMGGCALRGLVF
jgi:MoaA/NifB/PqqE/SkfB family radical SAM enzyme